MDKVWLTFLGRPVFTLLIALFVIRCDKASYRYTLVDLPVPHAVPFVRLLAKQTSAQG